MLTAAEHGRRVAVDAKCVHMANGINDCGSVAYGIWKAMQPTERAALRLAARPVPDSGLREALREVINVLGPEAPEHDDVCEGCQHEMGEAIDIARAALADTDAGKSVINLHAPDAASPGPWSLSETRGKRDGYVKDANGRTVADLRYRNGSADGALIVAAVNYVRSRLRPVPEDGLRLREALRDVLGAVEEGFGGTAVRIPNPGQRRAIVRTAEVLRSALEADHD